MNVKILDIDRSEFKKGASLSVSRQAEHKRNCNLSLYSKASSYVPSVGQDLKVYDDDNNLVFGGCIKSLNIQEFEKGNSDDSYLLLDLFSDGYNHITNRRTVTCAYSSAYAGDIVRDLLNKGLNNANNNEGLSTTGNIENGALFTYFQKNVSSIKDVYDDLAKASGFQWYIDDSKTLYFEQETTTPDAAHSLLSTGTFKDFFDMRIGYDLSEYRNKQFVIGGVDEDGLTIVAVSESTSQIAARLAVEGGSCYTSGVYGNVIKDVNIKTAAQALTVAQNSIKQNGLPGEISFRSYTLDWEPMTKLRVKLPKYGISTDAYYLIEDVSLDQETNNEMVATVNGKLKDVSSFGTQKSYDDVMFMTELVKIAKEKGTGGSVDDVQKSMVKDFNTCSTGQLTMTSSESTLLSKAISLDVKSDVKIFFSCSGESTAATHVEYKTYLDAAARTYQPKRDLTGSNHSISTYIDTIPELAAGSYTVSIKGIADANNYVIAAGFATLNILAIPLISDVIFVDVSDFVLTVVGATEIDLTWTNPDALYFTGVKLYRHSSSLASYNQVWCEANATSIYTGAGESYDDTGRSAETTYFYKIFASYEDHGTHYSLGVYGNATTDANPYQEWDAYPQSPQPTSEYPYQAITRYLTSYFVWMCKSRNYHVASIPEYIHTSNPAYGDASKSALSSGGVWAAPSTYELFELPMSEVLEANYDIYVSAWTSLSTPDVYFEKTTSP